jgi:hypothetical protein
MVGVMAVLIVRQHQHSMCSTAHILSHLDLPALWEGEEVTADFCLSICYLALLTTQSTPNTIASRPRWLVYVH